MTLRDLDDFLIDGWDEDPIEEDRALDAFLDKTDFFDETDENF